MKLPQILLVIWTIADIAFAVNNLSLSPGYARLVSRTSPSQSEGQLAQAAPKGSPETSLKQQGEDPTTGSTAKGQQFNSLGQAVHNGKPSNRDTVVDRAAPGSSLKSEGHQRVEQDKKLARPNARNTPKDIHYHKAITSDGANFKDEQKDLTDAYREAALAAKIRKPDRRNKHQPKKTFAKAISPADGHWEHYANLIRLRANL